MNKILKITIITVLATFLIVPVTASAQSLVELERQLRELEDKYQVLLEKVTEATPTERANRATDRTEGVDTYLAPDLNCLKISQNLRLGMVDIPDNEQIKELQIFLKAIGDYTYPRATGFFGPETNRAVTRFQQRIGVRPAEGFGVVEATTRDRIENISCVGGADKMVTITPGVIQSGIIDRSYFSEIRTLNESGTVVLALAEGRLPAGLIFTPTASGNAIIQGVPRVAGVTTFTVWAISAEGRIAVRTFQLIINDRDGTLFGP